MRQTITILLILLLTIVGITLKGQNDNSFQNSIDKKFIADSTELVITQRQFRYKDLDEAYLDSTDIVIPSNFFGNWTIQEIAKVGGTIQSERKIRAQIGKTLYLSNEEFRLNMWGQNIIAHKPKYTIETDGIDDNNKLKGTTFWCGYYRPERKKIHFLIVENKYFELISYNEIAIYLDGRIFIFQKDK